MFDTLIRRIFELSDSQPDKTAVAFKKETVTYRMLAQKIRNIGANLAHMGIKRGERVLFTALSKPEMVACYLGIQYCGAVAVFMDKNGTAENSVAVYEANQRVLSCHTNPSTIFFPTQLKGLV